MTTIHGGQIVARALRAQGVDMIFTLTGGHIVPILDGCVQEGIRVVDVRHEQTAAHAAEAYSRLTGRLGVAVVTAGPGATGTVTAVATALQSATPMLVIAGRHPVLHEKRGGLQEMDHPRLFESITKWASTATEVGSLGEFVGIAATNAFAGRGGPVFLDIPLDVQFDVADEASVAIPPLSVPAPTLADAGTIDRIVAALSAGERVMVFAGAAPGEGHEKTLDALASVLKAPVFLNSRARGGLAHDHPLLGNRSRSMAMAEADVVLALGVDWDFRTGFGENLRADSVLIHVDRDASKIGWNRPAEIGVLADPYAVVGQLLDRASEIERLETPEWTTRIMDEEAARWTEAMAAASSDSSPVVPDRFAREVGEFFGPDSIVAVDGGDIVSTTARWLRVSTAGHVLEPGPLGTLGGGPGYAIAAKSLFPGRRVGIVFGDGAFGFSGMEFDTMVRFDLPVIGVIGNDGVWSNIKTFHKMFFPDRLVATDLGRRPYHDFVSALGGYGELVTDPAEIQPALRRAEASGLPSLVNVHLAETMRMSSNYQQ